MQCCYQVGRFGHGIGLVRNQNMGVTLGGSYISMTQKSLYGPYVFCGHECIGCKLNWLNWGRTTVNACQLTIYVKNMPAF
jgi:hypothetical protein